MSGKANRNGDAGPFNLKALCRIETLENLRTLKRIRDDTKAPPVARLRAVEIMLDRGYGKAVQQIEMSDATSAHEMTDAELLEIVRSSGVVTPTQGTGQPH